MITVTISDEQCQRLGIKTAGEAYAKLDGLSPREFRQRKIEEPFVAQLYIEAERARSSERQLAERVDTLERKTKAIEEQQSFRSNKTRYGFMR